MADLTTLEDVRRQIFGNETTFDADELLTDLIGSSSAWVERKVGGDLLSASITETLDGNGKTRVLLSRSHSWRPGRPPTTITSVTVDGTAIPARPAVSASNTNPEGYVFRADGIDLVGYTFTKGPQNVVIVYTHGFAAVPADIEQATRVHVALKYHDRTRSGLGSMSGDGESATFSNAGDLGYIESVLAPFTVVGVG